MPGAAEDSLHIRFIVFLFHFLFHFSQLVFREVAAANPEGNGESDCEPCNDEQECQVDDIGSEVQLVERHENGNDEDGIFHDAPE